MDNIKPWRELELLLDNNDIEGLRIYLDQLDADEKVSVMSHISSDDRVKLISTIHPEIAAEIVGNIPDVQAVSLFGNLSAKSAAPIISELRSDDQADLLNELSDEDADAIMVEMEDEEAANIRRLIEYGTDTAGGVMITEFLSFEQDMTVDQVVSELRDNVEKYQDYNVQYIYVTRKGQFSGVLRMRDLLLSKTKTPLSEIVIKNARTVYDSTPIDELINFFKTYDFYGVPVLNDLNQLVGVVLRKDVRETETEMANRDLLETQGIVGGEELRTMPILLRSRRRLSWLSVNILLNILAASIIAIYTDTLQAVIALAVFLPVISDMSGCSGNQAVAVSLRELALGVVRPFEIFRVWVQEVSVGIINGIALGLLIGLVAWLWQGNIYLGLVVSAALAINTVVAVSLGGILPLFLKKMKVDPALASGPILTTVTDMFGFFLVLSLAGLMMNYLT